MYEKHVLFPDTADPSMRNRFFNEIDSNVATHFNPRAVYIDEDFEDIERAIINDKNNH